MAQAIALPKHSDLPDLVIFHREHPADPVLLMQVPTNEDRSAFETYLIKLDDEGHRGWMDRLPHAKDLIDKLGYEMHVAFSPRNGYFREMADLDEPNDAQMAVATARALARPEPLGKMVEKRRRIEKIAPLPVSRLRDALGGPEQRLGRFYGRGGFGR